MRVEPSLWSDLETDQPIPLLTRTKCEGSQMLAARVLLQAGCVVAVHSHPSEQMAMMLSGRARWTLGEQGSQYEVEMVGGQVLRLPGGFPHGLTALEDCVILDVLSPPGAMGVDSQGS